MNKKIEIELSDDLVNAYIPLSEAYDKGFKGGEKAGYIRGYDDACQVDCECGGENRYRAGRKEVVKWINETIFGNTEGYIFGEDPTFSTTAFHKLWEKQIKEWGIND